MVGVRVDCRFCQHNTFLENQTKKNYHLSSFYLAVYCCGCRQSCTHKHISRCIPDGDDSDKRIACTRHNFVNRWSCSKLWIIFLSRSVAATEMTNRNETEKAQSLLIDFHFVLKRIDQRRKKAISLSCISYSNHRNWYINKYETVPLTYTYSKCINQSPKKSGRI